MIKGGLAQNSNNSLLHGVARRPHAKASYGSSLSGLTSLLALLSRAVVLVRVRVERTVVAVVAVAGLANGSLFRPVGDADRERFHGPA